MSLLVKATGSHKTLLDKSTRLLDKLSAGFVHSGSSTSLVSPPDKLKSKYDAVIVGGGHNGLVSAAYLAKSGMSVAVLERRHLIGGAAVTEELVPGFKFSRASYVLSLLRPIIIKELDLKRHGLKWHVRTTGAFTPIRDSSDYLMLGLDSNVTQNQIAKFSTKDAKNYPKYGQEIGQCVEAFRHMLDHPMLHPDSSTRELIQAAKLFGKTGYKLGREFPKWYEFLTAPISKVLDRWFESDVLKATLATDGVIGAMISPHQSGSGYVLLHHEIGELDGVAGCWGFAEGGMGSVSRAIACSAKEHGAEIFVNSEVEDIVVSDDGNGVRGVKLNDGTFIQSNCVLSNATIHKTTKEMLRDCRSFHETEYAKQVSSFDYTSPVTKINVAVDRIPDFKAIPSKSRDMIGEQHKGTIHLNCENVEMLHEAYVDAAQHQIASRVPMIELCIPSSVDKTISPPNQHVISLFTQYTPYYLKGERWTQDDRKAYADKGSCTAGLGAFSAPHHLARYASASSLTRTQACSRLRNIDEYVSGFTDSIIGYDILTPEDLETTFGLTGGNIFHGAMSFDQLLFSRPSSSRCSYETPISGLYLCGSGTHPGGGVMGASGRLSALTVLKHRKEKRF